jgi:hypothetical protein
MQPREFAVRPQVTNPVYDACVLPRRRHRPDVGWQRGQPLEGSLAQQTLLDFDRGARGVPIRDGARFKRKRLRIASAKRNGCIWAHDGELTKISGEARSGGHRAGTYAARQDEEIASPYQTRVSFVRQLVPRWNRLGQRRQGPDTDRRFRLKNTTQEVCREVGLERTVTLGVWAITQKEVKGVHASRFDCPRDNREKQVVDDQLRHTTVQICWVGATLATRAKAGIRARVRRRLPGEVGIRSKIPAAGPAPPVPKRVPVQY